MTNTPEVLEVMIKNLTKDVKDGFKGIHDRQDTTNDKILKHANLITKLEKEDIRVGAEIKAVKEQRKTGRGTWIVVSTLVSIVLVLLGRYVY